MPRARPHSSWTAAAAVGLPRLLMPCLLTLACKRGGDPAPTRRASPPSPPASAAAAFDTAAVLDTLVRVIREQQLTTLAPACYSFEPDRGATPYHFTVREVHGGACGGDPQTAPRLFSIRWDPTTGDVETDAREPADGATDTIRRRRRTP